VLCVGVQVYVCACVCVSPVKALVGVVGQDERGDDETASHGAHLLTQPLGVLADALVARETQPGSRCRAVTINVA